MKIIFGLALAILVLMSSVYNGNAGNLSMRAASHEMRDKRIIEQLFAAWNAHDADKVASSFTEDAVYEDVPLGQINRGRADVRKFVQDTFSVVDDLKIETVSISIHKGRGTAEWVWSGIDKGLFKTGKKFSVRGISIFELRGEKISRYRDYYDFATIMGQVGMRPAEKE